MGKTILALHKAKEIEDSGVGTYLVIIYTLSLKTFIQDGITDLGLDPDRVCIYSRMDKLGYTDADYIIVDEVQDFSKEEIGKLMSMANKNFMFFGDDVQQLYVKGTALNNIKKLTEIQNNNHKKLKRNYRLPVKIAEYAKHVSVQQDNLVERCVKQAGEKPLLLEFDDFDQEMSYISNLISNEGWTDVGILCDSNKKVEEVVRKLQSLGMEVEYKYYEDTSLLDTIDFYSDKPKITTYHSSKGLQFEHVILPMCDVDYHDHNMQNALYVALTRASLDLIITYSKRLSPFLSWIPNQFYTHRKI